MKSADPRPPPASIEYVVYVISSDEPRIAANATTDGCGDRTLSNRRPNEASDTIHVTTSRSRSVPRDCCLSWTLGEHPELVSQ